MKTIPSALLLTLALDANFAAAQAEDDLPAFQQCIHNAKSDRERDDCYVHLGISAEDVKVARNRRIGELESCIGGLDSNESLTACILDSAPQMAPADQVRLAFHQDWRDSTEHPIKSWLDEFAASWWKGPGN